MKAAVRMKKQMEQLCKMRRNEVITCIFTLDSIIISINMNKNDFGKIIYLNEAAA